MNAPFRLRRAFPVVSLGIIVFACTPSTVDGAPPDAATDARAATDAGVFADADPGDLACQEFAYAFCNRTKTCSAEVFATRYGTESNCEASQQATCKIANIAPSTGETPTTTAACTAALGSWLCNDFLHSQNRPPACENETHGLLANGAPCGIFRQCQTGYCALDVGKACGTCASAPPPGASCVSAGCPTGLLCVQDICVPIAEQGSACSATSPCDDGLNCVGGICTPGVPTLGAACSYTGAGCDSTAGLACNAATQVCEVLQIAAVGQACGVVANQTTVCFASTCVRGVCVPLRQLGESCDLASGTPCALSRCIVSGDSGTVGTCQYAGATSCP